MTALEKAVARYGREYDRLFILSMRAGSAEEAARIDAELRTLNMKLKAAKAAERSSS